MGLIRNILRLGRKADDIGRAAERVSEVFIPNKTKEMEWEFKHADAALAQFNGEFQYVTLGVFDRFVNGVNRLPRPILAFGTVGLFVYAMVAPEKFALRMEGLALVPEPLWWLLGAIVSFYFGARELHHFRADLPLRRSIRNTKAKTPRGGDTNVSSRKKNIDIHTKDYNAALDEWRNMQRADTGI